MITADNISKSFGGQVLFDQTGFKLNSRERLGLVGRNGHGKTTLFRMIAGEESPDEGSITVPKNYRIGFIRQHLAFSEDTVLKEGALGLPAAERAQTWRVEKILAGLGFSAADLQRHPLEFSGGYQVRLNLAKVLVAEPDLLLLDEPTNYLDITSIRWIEKFLQNWPHELLLITHDRGFMDRVVTHTLGIHRRKLRKIAGDTSKYYDQVAQDEEIYEKTRLNDERKRQEIEKFVSRFRAKARLAGMVQSRIKALEKSEKRDRLEALKDLDFAFREKPFAAKQLMSVRDLGFGYSEPLIEGLNLEVGAHDRICIVGRNGRGKTTLLKLMAGFLEPQSGQVSWHPATEMGVFEQTNISSLCAERTIEAEIMSADAELTSQQARSLAGAMLFEGDLALKPIGVLSGGEKSRVMLAKILAKPINLLLLDEPTNHLDMESCDALIAALDSFDGAVVMVTHNEMFLHAIAERLVVFDGGKVEVFEGGYQDFLDRVGWSEENEGAQRIEAPADKSSRKDLRRQRSEIITERGKLLKPLETRIAELEDRIQALDERLRDLSHELQAAAEQCDGAAVHRVSLAIQEAETLNEQLFDELAAVTEDYEQLRAEFDQRLEALD
ncbi:MAG: putative ABC transporter ATP-binding protein YheS [Deltaproteobacteria bacterium ADurb.Bin510]|nr:MAG: putative ABC transporter ATP-binding protein YheS [Deltaproteobacteria bacterium ADurb.Bin510]